MVQLSQVLGFKPLALVRTWDLAIGAGVAWWFERGVSSGTVSYGLREAGVKFQSGT